jgi:hypothetical protein
MCTSLTLDFRIISLCVGLAPQFVHPCHLLLLLVSFGHGVDWIIQHFVLLLQRHVFVSRHIGRLTSTSYVNCTILN